MIQLPEDMIRIQAAIHRVQPVVIVDTGVANGASFAEEIPDFVFEGSVFPQNQGVVTERIAYRLGAFLQRRR